MTKALSVLYVDKSSKSADAERVLKGANIEFQRLFVRDPAYDGKRVPQLLTGDGFFDTLHDIGWYAQVYSQAPKK